ncbi:right-handed parallel beta-helix repeat-containing protein [Bacillus sp. REN16]|uniref:right-handed parallel beta-helix repeat-containing protein n=1 Tax=Bacillus sp. REN16 TaxID=2887296 RepID=UPI001E61702A|nr:nitrous oxide reductase family maturation protein NosD [Bacillus sp. REN16]MCC3358022.1 nitrous oxide reductase family maturation protein NosD [Bacillus sp. REN16]
MRRKVLFFLLFFLLLGQNDVWANERIVTSSLELKDAIQLSQPGDTIILEEGTYEDAFVINKSIILRGKPGAIINGPTSGYPITIEAENVTIENLQIEGGGSQNAGIYIKTNHAQITNNIIKNVFHGVYIKDGYGNVIENNEITSVEGVENNKGFGVYLVDAPYTRISGNYFHHLQDGIYVSFSDYCAVSNNLIEHARYGIHTMDSKTVTIAKNEINNSHNGLMIMQSDELYITENYLHSNTTIDGAGMFIFDTFDSVIKANVVKENFKGIYFENAKRNIVEFNAFIQNDIGFDLAKDTTNNVISLNNFIKNTKQVISRPENMNLFTKDGYGNYWDDQRMINLDEDSFIDFPYKGGDIFFNMTADEPLLQIFFQSPAVYLWNQIEAFTPIPTKHFIVDEHPLIKAAPISLGNTDPAESNEENKKDHHSFQIFLLVFFVSGSGFILWKTRRGKDEV